MRAFPRLQEEGGDARASAPTAWQLEQRFTKDSAQVREGHLGRQRLLAALPRTRPQSRREFQTRGGCRPRKKSHWCSRPPAAGARHLGQGRGQQVTAALLLAAWLEAARAAQHTHGCWSMPTATSHLFVHVQFIARGLQVVGVRVAGAHIFQQRPELQGQAAASGGGAPAVPSTAGRPGRRAELCDDRPPDSCVACKRGGMVGARRPTSTVPTAVEGSMGVNRK